MSRTDDHDEQGRLRALRAYGVLDTSRDEALDALVQVASTITGSPMAAISLVDANRQWLASEVGLGVKETPRDVSICTHAIRGTQIFSVRDVMQDPRFVENPAIASSGVRFYVGVPLIDRDGFALGTLCVMDREPKELTVAQTTMLEQLGRAVLRLLESRRVDAVLFAAEQAARSTRADLEVILEAVPVGVAYWDKDLICRLANGTHTQWFGNALGRHLRDAIGDDLFRLALPHADAALRGTSQRFERGRDGHHYVTMFTPDLREGIVQGFVATVTDVSELRNLLVESQQRTELLELSEEIAEVGHWRVELGKEETLWSPQVYRIYGVDPATYVPTVSKGIAAYHPDDRDRVRTLVARALDEKEPFEFEHRIVRPDGTIRLVRSIARCELDPETGAVRAIFGVFQDITEREALRATLARQERLATTGMLAAGVGHEINNPLTYIGSNLDFALELLKTAKHLDGAADAELADVLGEAREGADRIAKIVQGLRSFARESTSAASTGTANVRTAIETSSAMTVHELQTRAALVVDVGEVPLVRGDEARISQILINLFVNAAQAFPSNDVSKNRITVRTRRPDPHTVAIEVEDNGPGIPADILPRIFDPFFTTKGPKRGTGLGLSICQNIAAAIGAVLTCTSEPRRGTTFTLALSVGEPLRPSMLAPRPAAPSVRPAASRSRVLLIDDDEHVLRSMTRALRGEHEVVGFTDPREALALLERDASFDVLFCDVTMPHLSGMDVHRALALGHPELTDRLVFITGGSIVEEIHQFLGQMVNPYLSKPFGKGELERVAREMVARHREG